MLRLRTFGGLGVARLEEEGPAEAPLQRRPLALLAVLAAACGRGCAREDLLLYLWPDSTPGRARNVLKQTLYAIRRDLKAPDLFLADHDILRLNPAAITTDVGEFEAALERGDLGDALELYRGPFLEGFHLKESPEFERWRETARARLADEFARAATGEAERAAEKGELDRAIAVWRRLAAADPLDPEAALGLMHALAAAGDHTAAVRHARVYETLLEREPGRPPDPRITTLASELRTEEPRPSRPVQLPAEAATSAQPGTPSRRRAGLTVVLVGLLLIPLLLGGDKPYPKAPRSGSADLVVVAPFRVAAADPELLYLREGMMDLLAAKLTGDAGPRAVSPRTVAVAWRREARGGDGEVPETAALRIADRLGASRLLLGTVVGTTDRISLTASLLHTPGGRAVLQVSVEGPIDSLPHLVDRLAAQVLIGSAGGAQAGIDSPVTASLPALRAYLNGTAAYRRAEYHDAIQHFERALDYDSTFALAAFRLALTGYWLRGSAWLTRLDVAWRYRDRLSTRDRTLLEAIAGLHYPATAFWAEDLAAAERAVEAAPDSPEAWFLLGDVLFHLGPGLARGAPWVEAERAFSQALALDSTFTAPLEHLLELAASSGRLAELRRLAALYFGQERAGEHADFLRWRTAVALGDSAELDRVRRRFAAMSTAGLLRVVGTGQLDGLAPGDVDRAAAVLRTRPAPESERWLVGRTLHYLALNRGRARAAATEVPPPSHGEPLPGWADRMAVLDGLFGEGDTLAAIRALARMERRLAGPAPEGATGRAAHDADLCVAEHWRTLLRRGARTASTIARLRRPWAGEDSLGAVRSNALCAAMLEAVEEQRTRPGGASPALLRMDSLMLLGPAATNDAETFGNLLLAGLYEEGGSPREALAAIRRRPYQWAYGPMFLADFLRVEGRLAARVGDREGAVRAYRHYLTLRTAPDPGLHGEVREVRRELAALEPAA